jgi:hypothetical protein
VQFPPPQHVLRCYTVLYGISFFIKDSILFGWQKLREHSALLFGATLTLFALEIAMSMTERTFGVTVPGLLVSFALGVVGLVIGCGFTLIALRVAEDVPATYRDMLPPGRLVWKYFCASVVAGILTIAPAAFAFIALVAGGYYVLGDQFFAVARELGGNVIFAMGPSFDVFVSLLFSITIVAVAYIALRLSMVRFAVVDGSAVEESIKRSVGMTREYKWEVLLFIVVILLLNLLGMALFMVGLLVTIPISTLAFAHVYLALKKGA